jgi:hypothetical protein
MNGHRFNVWFARIGSAAVTVGALLGSSVHLALMAQAHGVDPFWGPPLALDAMALVAGAVRRVRRDDRLALALLAGPVVLSWWLQVSDHWQAHQGDLIGAAMAGAPPLAAWGVFELFLRAVDADTEHAPEHVFEHAEEATPSTPSSTVPSTPTEPVAGAPAHAPRSRSTTRPKTAQVPLPTLVRRAERLAAKRDVAPSGLSQRVLKTELGIGTDRAREVQAALRRPVLEVVDGARR